ncbi:MAG: hypothetical protein ACM3XZ_03270 [Betaproteobacteria bacterium]
MMGYDYARHLRGYVRHLDEMCATCDRWIATADPPVRRRLIFARRGLGVARLAFLAILGLLGVAGR